MHSDWQYPGRLQYYGTKFVRPLPDKEEDELLTPQIRVLLKQKKWAVKSVNFELERYLKLFSLIKESPADELSLSQNCRSSILVEIRDIKFNKLQNLNLSLNRIRNIEALAKIQAPYLSSLDVSKNKITSVKPLRKVHFPLLQRLALFSNPITDLSPLCQLKTNKFFINFNLQEYVDESMFMSDDIRWLAKAQANKLSILNLWSRKMIPQKKWTNMIKHKFPFVEINQLLTVDDPLSDENSDESDDQ